MCHCVTVALKFMQIWQVIKLWAMILIWSRKITCIGQPAISTEAPPSAPPTSVKAPMARQLRTASHSTTKSTG